MATWIKESEDVYSEGVYYKVNQAIILKKITKSEKNHLKIPNLFNYRVTQRNTYTGKKKTLDYFGTKEEARKFMREFIKKHPMGTLSKQKRV